MPFSKLNKNIILFNYGAVSFLTRIAIQEPFCRIFTLLNSSCALILSVCCNLQSIRHIDDLCLFSQAFSGSLTPVKPANTTSSSFLSEPFTVSASSHRFADIRHAAIAVFHINLTGLRVKSCNRLIKIFSFCCNSESSSSYVTSP